MKHIFRKSETWEFEIGFGLLSDDSIYFRICFWKWQLLCGWRPFGYRITPGGGGLKIVERKKVA